jgi:hypothetical protein
MNVYECKSCGRDDRCVLIVEDDEYTKPMVCPYIPRSDTTATWKRVA